MYRKCLLTVKQLELCKEVASKLEGNLEKNTQLIITLFERFVRLHSKKFVFEDGTISYRLPHHTVEIYSETFYKGICNKREYLKVLPLMKGILIQTDEKYISPIKSNNGKTVCKRYSYAEGAFDFDNQEIVVVNIDNKVLLNQYNKNLEERINTTEMSYEMIMEQKRLSKFTLRQGWEKGVAEYIEMKLDEINYKQKQYKQDCINKGIEVNYKVYDSFNNDKMEMIGFRHNLTEQCNRIINGHITLSCDVDGGGRIYSPFTTLPSSFESKYVVEKETNKNIYKIDLKGSQVNCLYAFLNNPNIVKFDNNIDYDIIARPDYMEVKDLKRILQEEDFYTYINELQERKDSKKGFMQMIFGQHNKTYTFEKQFKNKFPSILNFIIALKKQISHIAVSIALRQIESNLFIKTISKKLEEEGILFYTKHDSIQFIEQDDNTISKVESIVRTILNSNLDLEVQLHIEDYLGNEVTKKQLF